MAWCQLASLDPRNCWLPIKRLLSPLGEALTGKRGGDGGLSVEGGVDTEHHLAGIGLLRFFPERGAGFDVIVHSLVKGFLQPGDRIGIQADNIVDTSEPADEASSLSNSMRAL